MLQHMMQQAVKKAKKKIIPKDLSSFPPSPSSSSSSSPAADALRRRLPPSFGSVPIVSDAELDALEASGIQVMELEIAPDGQVKGFKERTIRKGKKTEGGKQGEGKEGEDDEEEESEDLEILSSFPAGNAAAVLRAVESLKKTLNGAAQVQAMAAAARGEGKGAATEGTAEGEKGVGEKASGGGVEELFKAYNIENVQAFTLGDDGETR